MSGAKGAANRGLGRGLAALLGEAVATPSRPDRTSLPVSALVPGPFQPRTNMDPAALADLTASIKEQGVLQPILARPHPDEPGRYQIIAGERRWRATQAAGLHEIPVLIRPLDDTQAMAAGLVENLQREDLDPIEEAEGYRRLQDDFGLTQDHLGNLVGKSRSHITNTIRLLNLPDVVRLQVSQRALTAGHARALLGHPEPEAAARQIIARGLNVRQAEAMTSRKATPSVRPAVPAEDVERVALERELSLMIGLQVRIQPGAGTGGAMHITFRTLDQLDALIDRLRTSRWDGADQDQP